MCRPCKNGDQPFKQHEGSTYRCHSRVAMTRAPNRGTWRRGLPCSPTDASCSMNARAGSMGAAVCSTEAPACSTEARRPVLQHRRSVQGSRWPVLETSRRNGLERMRICLLERVCLLDVQITRHHVSSFLRRRNKVDVNRTESHHSLERIKDIPLVLPSTRRERRKKRRSNRL